MRNKGYTGASDWALFGTIDHTVCSIITLIGVYNPNNWPLLSRFILSASKLLITLASFKWLHGLLKTLTI